MKELLLENFKKFEPTTEHLNYFKELFFKTNRLHCEFNIVNFFNWNDSVDYRYIEYKNRVLLYTNVYDYLYFPFGELFDLSEIIKICTSFKEQGKSGSMIMFEREHLLNYPDIEKYFRVELDRDMSDYIYDATDLALLPGRKFSKKRNLIHQFKKDYPDYETILLNHSHIEECLKLSIKWKEDKEALGESDNLIDEYNALLNSFKFFDVLELAGVGIKIENQIVAFAIFSRQNSNAVSIHFEKADHSFKGLGQVINQETAIYLKSKNIELINREQDMGELGLRQAKLSYHPKFLLDQFTISLL